MKISDLPKQFLDLEGKPIIIHTIEKFILVNEFEAIYIGINVQWKKYFVDLLGKYFGPDVLAKLHVVSGGESRNETIENIIHEILSSGDIAEGDLLVTHDAVRPFVSLRIIAENIEMCEKHAMVDTVIPAHDTIVISKNAQTIDDIPVRDNMYQGQTPQTFDILRYIHYYHQLSEEAKATLTDACKVFILNGAPVGLVRGDESNIKITTVKDLKLARAMLGEEK